MPQKKTIRIPDSNVLSLRLIERYWRNGVLGRLTLSLYFCNILKCLSFYRSGIPLCYFRKYGYFAVLLIHLISFSSEALQNAQGVVPTVLVVNVGKTEDARLREDRFAVNLKLNIDGFNIHRVSLAGEDFGNMSLNRQIEQLKPIMSRHNAVAAMWLTESSDNVLLLQVVVLDTGRALVRLFEEDLSGSSEESLALTAGELLGTAYMFEPPEKPKPEPIKKLVDEVKKQVAVSPSEKETLQSLWKLIVEGHYIYGAVLGKGPNMYAGGAVFAERLVGNIWFLGIGLSAAAGPLGESEKFSFSGYEMGALFNTYIGGRINKIRLGPSLQVRAGSQSVMVSSKEYERSDYSFWNLVFRLGLDLRIPLNSKVSLKIAGGMEAAALQSEVQKLSDNEPLYENPIIRAWAGLGLVLF